MFISMPYVRTYAGCLFSAICITHTTITFGMEVEGNMTAAIPLTPSSVQISVPSLKSLCINRYVELLFNPQYNHITQNNEKAIPPEVDLALAKEIIDRTLIATIQKSIKYKINNPQLALTSYTAYLCPTAAMHNCYIIFNNKEAPFTYLKPFSSQRNEGYELHNSGSTLCTFDSSPNRAWGVNVCVWPNKKTVLNITSNPLTQARLHAKQTIDVAANYKVIFLNNDTFVLEADKKLFLYHIIDPTKATQNNTKFTCQEICIEDISDAWAQEYLMRQESTVDTRCAHMAYAAAGQKPFFNTSCLHELDIKQELSKHPRKNILLKQVCDHEHDIHFYVQQNSGNTDYTMTAVTFEPEPRLKHVLQCMNTLITPTPQHLLFPNALYIYHTATNNWRTSQEQLAEKMGVLGEHVSAEIIQAVTRT